MKYKSNNAFTLVELAIVIVIIGLLVGGVLQGQELIRQSKIRKVLKSAEEYKAAIITFNGKYNCLPGDCINATNFLTSTTNGNGNKILDWTVAGGSENILLWQHLAKANLIKGSYDVTGASIVSNSYVLQPGVNSPVLFDNVTANILSGTAWNMAWSNTDGFSVPHLSFGAIQPTTNPHSWYAFLTTDEVYGIDLKQDDGLPGKGSTRVHTRASSSGTLLCTNTTDANTSVYQVSNTGINCHIVFLLYGI